MLLIKTSLSSTNAKTQMSLLKNVLMKEVLVKIVKLSHMLVSTSSFWFTASKVIHVI